MHRVCWIAIATVVFAASGHLGTATSVNAGFGSALVTCAGFSLLGTGLALGVRAQRRTAVRPELQPVPDAPAPGAAIKVGNP